MEIKIDKEVCIGCGTCVALAGKSFQMADDGKAEPVNPPGDDQETVQMAADSCPVKCITIQ